MSRFVRPSLLSSWSVSPYGKPLTLFLDMKSPEALGGSGVGLHIYSGNAGALWKRAVDAGAKVRMPLQNMFWGERYGQLVDPFGHSWSISQRTEILTEKEHAQRAEEAIKHFGRQMQQSQPSS